MAKLNVSTKHKTKTFEGAPATIPNAEEQLRRSVMACMLWEKSFYESGEDIADRIEKLVPQVNAAADIAIEARSKMNLRHVPLLICAALAKAGKLKKDVLTSVIQRPDELAEFLAIYWRNGRCPISAQAKKGLAAAFRKFGAYQIAKYNRDGAVKLRDVLFMCHAKPKDQEQDVLWKNLINDKLVPPDTWEVALSSGADKKSAWSRLLSEKKLGALALLRNLRNMKETGVDEKLIFSALDGMNTSRILPFRFVAAAVHAPQWEPEIEQAMFKSLADRPKLKGKTTVVVDISGSMEYDKVSKRSDMTRKDAATALAIICRELCEQVVVFAFHNQTFLVPPRRGFALRDAINGFGTGGTYLGAALQRAMGEKPDRIICITDEQSHDRVPTPACQGYIINVAGYNRGVGYGQWLHISGWSESVLDYIREYESAAA